MKPKLASKTAIVGVGISNYHRLYRNPDPGIKAEQLGVEVLRDALDDAGLRVADVDGLNTSAIDSYPDFAYQSGLRDVRFLVPYPMSGRMCAVALAHAAMAIEFGLANCVALVYATNQRSAGMRYGGGMGEGGGSMYDAAYGMTSPGAFYALAHSRYLDQYGYRGRDEMLGAVAIAIRRHASLNPAAVMRQPLTLEDYSRSRYIARPLRLVDYCLVTDGAVCYIVTSIERARDLSKAPVRIAAFTEQTALREWFVPEDLWYSTCRTMAQSVFGASGLSHRDISSFGVYDNFSVAVPWALEGFGFCAQGEGLRWIQDGRIELGGELPVNTSGGMLSEAYMQGWNVHAEAVRQLRGECGQRQIKDCSAVLYTCLAPVASATILTRE
jgi:acetyl-CoA acetyltransferase